MSEIKALEKLRESSHLDDSKWSLETGEVIHVFGYKPEDPNAVNWGEQWRKIADEIQNEVDSRFCELPVDADGVPIHVGEEMTCHGDVFTVCAVAPAKIHRWVTVKLGETQTTYSYDPMECTHYNPRTLEDVLVEYAETIDVTSWKKAHDNRSFTVGEWEEIVRSEAEKCADEIRELMKEGGDD